MALELPAEWALVAVNKYLPGPYLSVVSDQWEDLVRSVLPAHVNTAINQFLEHNASAHAKNLPLMNPFDVVLIILVYLVVIFGGMLVMKAFEPLNVKYFSMLHNLFLVLLSGAYLSFLFFFSRYNPTHPKSGFFLSCHRLYDGRGPSPG